METMSQGGLPLRVVGERVKTVMLKTIDGQLIAVSSAELIGVSVHIHLGLKVTDLIDLLTEGSKQQLYVMAREVILRSGYNPFINPVLTEFQTSPGKIIVSERR